MCTGLNCYSCPGAVGSCPIGSLQSSIGSKYKISLYVAGLLIFVGALFGRFICGWMCPFGLVQEMLQSLSKAAKPVFGVRIWQIHDTIDVSPRPVFPAKGGRYLRSAIHMPCGTLEAGIPLVALNECCCSILLWLYYWKMILLAFGDYVAG